MKRVTISRATHAALKDYSYRAHRRWITERGTLHVDPDNVSIEVDDEVYRQLTKDGLEPEDAILKALAGKLS